MTYRELLALKVPFLVVSAYDANIYYLFTGNGNAFVDIDTETVHTLLPNHLDVSPKDYLILDSNYHPNTIVNDFFTATSTGSVELISIKNGIDKSIDIDVSNRVCTCDLFTVIMRTGCRCGGV